MKNRTITSIINNEYREFSLYQVSKLTSVRDGLKPVTRRILQVARKYKNKGFLKVIELSGLVAPYHPHGDCLRNESDILLSDGTFLSFKDWTEKYPNERKEILAYDTEKDEIIKVQVDPPRMGQIVEEIYEIELEDGSKIYSSDNHRFLMDSGEYISAKNLKEGENISSISSSQISQIINKKVY